MQGSKIFFEKEFKPKLRMTSSIQVYISIQKPFSNCSILVTTFYVRLQVQRNEYNEDVELSRPHVQFYMHKKARNGS